MCSVLELRRGPVPSGTIQVMFKRALATAFVLTVVTYAVFIYLWPSVKPDAATMTVVFAIWFGSSALVGWLWRRCRGKGGGNG